jgi:hypothetical protein
MTSRDEDSTKLPGGVKPAASVCAVKTALLRESFLLINVAILFQLLVFHCLQRLLRPSDQNVMSRVNKRASFRRNQQANRMRAKRRALVHWYEFKRSLI